MSGPINHHWKSFLCINYAWMAWMMAILRHEAILKYYSFFTPEYWFTSCCLAALELMVIRARENLPINWDLKNRSTWLLWNAAQWHLTCAEIRICVSLSPYLRDAAGSKPKKQSASGYSQLGNFLNERPSPEANSAQNWFFVEKEHRKEGFKVMRSS